MKQSIKISRLLIQFSFLFWSIIFSISNGKYFIHSLFIAVIFILISIPKPSFNLEDKCVHTSTKQIILFLVLLIAILNIPELVIRNAFINAGRITEEIALSESQIGTGRSLGRLLYSSFQLLPILLLDLYKKNKFVIIFVLVFLFFVSGSSRGYITIVLLSFFISRILRNKQKFKFSDLMKLGMSGFLIIIFFIILSLLRDGQSLSQFGILPLFYGFYFPSYNASLLLSTGYERNFLLLYKDLFLKFIPSSIYPGKEIFSFNIEMTYMIYDYMQIVGLESISVFTYITEFIIYKPILLSVVLPALTLLFFYRLIFRICFKYNLNNTIIYISLYTFIVLKSRVLDLISFQVFTLISLILMDLINRVKIRNQIK